jgi:hypothetical protein
VSSLPGYLERVALTQVLPLVQQHGLQPAVRERSHQASTYQDAGTEIAVAEGNRHREVDDVELALEAEAAHRRCQGVTIA